jgi:hypothetical protein
VVETRTLFEEAAEWQKRKSAGETQVSIANSANRSQAGISRTLKCGRLPTDEKQRYRQMILDRCITQGTVMDLADCGDLGFRQLVLGLAIRHRKAKDVESAKQSGKKGMTSDTGKVTVDEIRSAVKELHAKMGR